MFFDLLPILRIFFMKEPIFVTLKSDQDTDPHWFGPLIRICIEKKSWMRMRIRIKTNADTQHCMKGWSSIPFLLEENVSWIPGPITFTLGSGAAAHPEVVSGVGISGPVSNSDLVLPQGPHIITVADPDN
jgi:hypothetical protein